MTRVLFIARYRGAGMQHKPTLLATAHGLDVRAIYPATWDDEHLSVRQAPQASGPAPVAVLGLLGRATDPHRSLYRTLTFGLRGFMPDIIHAEEEPDSLAALQVAAARHTWAPRARLVLNTWQNQARPLSGPVRWVLRTTLSASDVVLCANTEAAALLRRHGYRRPAPVLPAIGVDTRQFTPRPISPREGSFVIGYAGRLVPEKGLDVLINAVSGLAARQSGAIELRLIGSGPARPALEAQATAAGLSGLVHFLPSVPPAAMPAALQALDVLVLPSRTTPTWKEQFGRVLTEAMACGVPVIGSSSGAIPEVVGEAGLIFAEGKPAALTGQLHRLQTDIAARADLAQRGLMRVRQHYTQDHLAARTAAVYRALLTGAEVV